ncbi:MAG: hypothetical protein KF789_14445, partial [Bdellovibrionaceae bacterium]|nr:hypothetical protein [Pseudobdellovibrionaceae bacterium]
MNGRIILLTGLLLLSLSAVGAPKQKGPGILSTSGKAEVMAARDEVYRPASTGLALVEKARFRTGPDGRLK